MKKDLTYCPLVNHPVVVDGDKINPGDISTIIRKAIDGYCRALLNINL